METIILLTSVMHSLVTKAFPLSNVLQLFKYLIICLLLAEDKLI